MKELHYLIIESDLRYSLDDNGDVADSIFIPHIVVDTRSQLICAGRHVCIHRQFAVLRQIEAGQRLLPRECLVAQIPIVCVLNL